MANAIRACLALAVCAASVAALEGELPVDEANADGVEALEERVRVDPFNREARVGLVSHYSRERFGDEDMARRHAEHVLWLVEHAPRQPLHGTPAGRIYPRKNSQEYAQAKALWLGHVGRAPGDVTLLGNAAAFFTSADRDLAISLLGSAREADPDNPELAFKLGHQYWLAAGPEQAPADDPRLALAATHLERAYELAGSGKPMSGQYAVHAMRIAFAVGRHADARTYAEQALGEPCGGCDARHKVNVVLGRIALAEGDVGSAKAHLLAAGRVDGSPVLGSFGPNMALAKELLEHGERETVLEYFELCSRFWDPEKLGVWADLVRAGRIPDFGGNLLY